MTRTESDRTEVINFAEKTDHQLIELILAGDETAFEHIFERYKRLVAVTASRYFNRPEQVEEIIQISFAKIYFELHKFRGANDFSLASWFGKIATNACIDILRTQKRKPENLFSDFSELDGKAVLNNFIQDNECAETSMVHRDLAEKLLSHLEADDRAILQMLYAEELNISEITKITGWSNSKIKIRAFRARNKLRKILVKFI